jgi:hypothetical protein
VGYKLLPLGETIVRRGGADDQSRDDLLVLELMKRAPGLEREELQAIFVACLTEYGEDALEAVQSGHVQFEEVRAGTRPSEVGNGERD